MTVQDIARFFPTPEDADVAFALFDKDMNGDATRDEVEIACMYVLGAPSTRMSADYDPLTPIGSATASSCPSSTPCATWTVLLAASITS